MYLCVCVVGVGALALDLLTAMSVIPADVTLNSNWQEIRVCNENAKMSIINSCGQGINKTQPIMVLKLRRTEVFPQSHFTQRHLKNKLHESI